MRLFTPTTPFQLELLEPRRLLSTLIVTSAADSGAGSLRAQIAAAQSGDTITFAPRLADQTITLTSGYLAIAKSLAIQGPGADRLTISGNDASMVFWIKSGTTNVQIRDLTIAHGSPAIANDGVLMVSNSTLSGNSYSFGGAIANTGTLTISGSALSGNTASGFSFYGAFGGALYSAGGAVTVSNCTFFDNHAFGAQVPVYDLDSWVYLGSEGYDAYGGAMYVDGGTARIDNSTFVGNSAVGGYGDIGLRQGVGYYGGLAGVHVSNSIIAGNSASYSPDGDFTSLGHNLIGNSSGNGGLVASDLLDANPQIGPLQNNGGPTQTIALLPGSPAINAGDNTNAPVYDQRGAGFARIVGGTIDIGAFESGNELGRTWIGPASGGNWSTAANWSPSGMPGADDLVHISGKSVNLSANATIGGLNLTDGAKLTLAANGNRVLRASSVSIGASSSLDLHDNALLVDYTGDSPASFVRDHLVSGRNGGVWNGPGLSSGAATPATGLGFAEATALFTAFPASFGGQSVDATSILVRYTLLGDANLDRRVDVTDLGTLASHWQQSPRVFSQGDFNYDAVVDIADLGILASNWQVTMNGSSSPAPWQPRSAFTDQSRAPGRGRVIREFASELLFGELAR
jgi:hypothetical protein